jgi:DNA modification methylase
MNFDTNLIYCGDNLEVMSKFPEKSIDLIYADPPFSTDKQYNIIWHNGAEQKAYEDRWKGGINAYIRWMRPRIAQCYRVLKDTGSMYLHCDWHANAHLRILMGSIFGENNFVSEIIWRRKSQSATIASNMRSFGNNHDVILFYGKSSDYIFNRLIIQRKVDSKDYPHDEKGYYKTAPADAPGQFSKQTLQRMLDEGKAYRTRGQRIRKKTYLVMKGGELFDTTAVDNIWLDLPNMMHVPKSERMGFQTQKPEALLKRIIEASSNHDNIVLDPFCGCGTTLVVAHQLGRRWVGIDISPTACDKMRSRLNNIGVSDVHIIGAPMTIEELKRLPDWEFQNWVIRQIHGTPRTKKTADMGIDGYVFMTQDPVQAKQQERVGRNVVDNFETAIRREHKTKGFIIAFSFTKGAYEEAARAELEENLDIKLVRVDEMDKHF